MVNPNCLKTRTFYPDNANTAAPAQEQFYSEKAHALYTQLVLSILLVDKMESWGLA